jgi:protein-S-isoprenylcysteine O-methyltransferase Ste14
MTVPQIIVAASWLGVFAGWVGQWRRAQQTRQTESGRRVNKASRAGMAVELGSFAALLASPRAPVPAGAAWCGAGLSVGAALLGFTAGQHLGRQMRVQAVVTDEHRLIRTGPYAVVRHPIYAALLPFLVGTALAGGRIRGLAVALPMYFLGTEIRVRAEDKLLAERFGAEFEEYRKEVAAYLPGVR